MIISDKRYENATRFKTNPTYHGPRPRYGLDFLTRNVIKGFAKPLLCPKSAFYSASSATYDVQAFICSHRLNHLDYVDYKYTYQEEFEFLKSNWS